MGQSKVGAYGVWWGSGPDVRAQGLVEGIHISKENVNAKGQVTYPGFSYTEYAQSSLPM